MFCIEWITRTNQDSEKASLLNEMHAPNASNNYARKRSGALHVTVGASDVVETVHSETCLILPDWDFVKKSRDPNACQIRQNSSEFFHKSP